tara:strand:- start:901 stop:1281 length:381 start_codon:yes stop_codon:yes gene_type:complete
MKFGNLNIIFCLFTFFYSSSSYADLIEGQSVEMQILNKITSKINNINIDINNSHEYETLNIEVFMCYKRPPEDIPEDFALLRIFDVIKDSKEKVFQGWMISSSPSAAPFEHPIYDIWIKNCNIKKI